MKPIVIDLGKVSKKALAELARGGGKLQRRVDEAIAALEPSEDRVPVVLLYRKKKRSKGPLDCPM